MNLPKSTEFFFSPGFFSFVTNYYFGRLFLKVPLQYLFETYNGTALKHALGDIRDIA
jgi:hypothetical protein